MALIAAHLNAEIVLVVAVQRLDNFKLRLPFYFLGFRLFIYLFIYLVKGYSPVIRTGSPQGCGAMSVPVFITKVAQDVKLI